jgi:hypothetical protein
MKYLAFLAVLLAGCSTFASYETPPVVGGQVLTGLKIAEATLSADDKVLVKQYAVIVGQVLVGLQGSTAPDPAALDKLIASELSNKNQRIVALIRAEVAQIYPIVYAKYSHNNAKLIQYLVSIGNSLQLAMTGPFRPHGTNTFAFLPPTNGGHVA